MQKSESELADAAQRMQRTQTKLDAEVVSAEQALAALSSSSSSSSPECSERERLHARLDDARQAALAHAALREARDHSAAEVGAPHSHHPSLNTIHISSRPLSVFPLAVHVVPSLAR